MRFYLSGFVLFTLFTGLATAETPSTSGLVGGMEVKIGLPEGYGRVDGINAQYDQIVSSVVPPTNRLLVELGSAAKRGALLKGESPAFESRAFNVQVIRQLEMLNISEPDFGQLKDVFRDPVLVNQTKALVDENLERGSAEVSNILGAETKLEVTELGAIGIISEDPNHLTFGMTFGVDVQVEADQEAAKAYVVTTVLRLHGKVICLYCNTLDTPEERTWALRQMATWVRDTVKLNEGLAEEMKSVPVSDLGL